MTCAFCKTTSFGCTPGRCFGPRGRTDQEKPPPAAKVLAPPVGPKRVVLTSHRRAGPNGGGFWLLELECGHEVWRRGGKKAPKTETCVGCGEPLMAACGCGCQKVATIEERATKWTWFRFRWYAPGHRPAATDHAGPGPTE
jgi:hypothetical protein